MHESKTKLLSYVPQGRVLTVQLGGEFDPPGEWLNVKISKWREHRSTEANRKFWLLCGLLAAAVKRPPEAIYLDYIRDVGDNYDCLAMPNEAVTRFTKIWRARGIGWPCEVLDTNIDPKLTDVICYYGSSTYTTAQMSRLLELIIADCKEQGIETMSPDEVERMLSHWEQSTA